MSHLHRATWVVVSFLVLNSVAGVLPSQTSSPEKSTISTKDVRTATPHQLSVDDLRRRQYLPEYICGYDAGAVNTISCADTSLSCVATLLPNGQAYQYCSTPGAAAQVIATAAIPAGQWTYPDCPDYTLCCGTDTPDVDINLYVAGGYTVTGFACFTTALQFTWNPATNLFVPAQFSEALASLGNKPQSVTSISDAVRQPVNNNDVDPVSSTTLSTTPTNPQPHFTSQSTSQSTPQSSTTAKSMGAFSESNKIGLGVGIGVGLPATLAGIAMCWMECRKRNRK